MKGIYMAKGVNQMSNEMIERVAKILANQGESSDYSALARRVIEAMREPTVPMIKAIVKNYGYLNSKGFWADIWSTGIDAALKRD